MKRNRIRICGRKTSTLPAPAMTPSTSRLRSGPSAMCAVIHSPTPAIAALIASIGTSAHENTAWNIRNRTTASSARPQTGCITTASMRCWKRRTAAAPGAARARMRRTSSCRSADERASRRGSGSRRPRSPPLGSAVAEPRLEQGEQPGVAVGLHRDRLDHRAAELGGEPVDVDRQALRRGRRRPC